MKKRWSRKGSDHVDMGVFVALACGVIPFLLVHGVWGELLQKAYLLTALLLFVVFWANWESIAERWFWKTLAVVILAHSVIVFGIAKINFEFPDIDRTPGMVYSALSLVFTAEVLASRRLIEACRPKRKQTK